MVDYILSVERNLFLLVHIDECRWEYFRDEKNSIIRIDVSNVMTLDKFCLSNPLHNKIPMADRINLVSPVTKIAKIFKYSGFYQFKFSDKFEVYYSNFNDNDEVEHRMTLVIYSLAVEKYRDGKIVGIRENLYV